MLDDLLWHELEVIRFFFARALSWSEAQSAVENAALSRMEKPDNETIEEVVMHPHGAHSMEQIAIRSVINELNALCDFALQNTWRAVTSEHELPKSEIVFTATRGQIEKALLARGVDVQSWPRWIDILKIKELSEGFKHRQRLQPLPVELQKPGLEWRATRLIDPSNVEWIATYELKPSQAAESLAAVEELLGWLRQQYAI